jgi:hypothetical protein
MSAALPITPVQNPHSRRWIIESQLPGGELVFLDGLTGVGKSNTAAHYAATLSRLMLVDHPTAVLYLSSSSTRESRDYHLSVHQTNMNHIRQIEFMTFLETLAPGDKVGSKFCGFIQAELLEHRPLLMVIDSIEEMLDSFKLTTEEAEAMFHLLREIARLSGCTLLLPRRCGMHERHYSTLGRAGANVGEYIMTLHWHPIHADRRVITIAKNIRGPMGDQWHQRYLPDGRFVSQFMEAHQHVRPAKSPATWKADPAVKNKFHEIIAVLKDKMEKEKITAVAELQKIVLEMGYKEHEFRSAAAMMGVEAVRQKGYEYHYVDKLVVAAHYFDKQLAHEEKQANELQRLRQQRKEKKALAKTIEEAAHTTDTRQMSLAPEAPAPKADAHTIKQAS